MNKKNSTAIYLFASIIAMIALAYGSVPLYRLFCQTTGFGGTIQTAERAPLSLSNQRTKIEKGSVESENIHKLNKRLTVEFNSDTSDTMPWKFQSTQREIKVLVGETALAFFTAYNPTDKSIIGISTYNVTPQKAGVYFNKIQCFCFEEQRLKAGEQIDMPVLFFIDPDFLDDPKMAEISTITLSYTFFSINSDSDNLS